MNDSQARVHGTWRNGQTELAYIPTKEQLGVLKGIISRLRRQNMRTATFEAFDGMIAITYTPYRDSGEPRLRSKST